MHFRDLARTASTWAIDRSGTIWLDLRLEEKSASLRARHCSSGSGSGPASRACRGVAAARSPRRMRRYPLPCTFGDAEPLRVAEDGFRDAQERTAHSDEAVHWVFVVVVGDVQWVLPVFVYRSVLVFVLFRTAIVSFTDGRSPSLASLDPIGFVRQPGTGFAAWWQHQRVLHRLELELELRRLRLLLCSLLPLEAASTATPEQRAA